MRGMVAENLSSVEAAKELRVSLLEQRGSLSAYITDSGTRSLLEELERRRPSFARWLETARQTAHTPDERAIIGQLEEVYGRFDARSAEVVRRYDQGRTQEAMALWRREVRPQLEQAEHLCEAFIAMNERLIDGKVVDGERRLRADTLATGVLMALSIGLSLGLLWFFYYRILVPLRQMTSDARRFAGAGSFPASPRSPDDELRAVGHYLRALISDVAETRTDLERSRDRLLSTEKLASVGKVAASVAHEIRDPLTSLKMRLVPLRRSIGEDPPHQDDLRVVSE
jgi:signal transduction histidine kinase